jgi:hypothetical protein
MPLVDYTTKSSAAILGRVEWEDDRRREMNLKWFGRKLSWSKSRYYPGIFLEGPRKTTKTSVSVAGVSTENRIQHILNRSLILCHGTEANGIDCSFAGTCHCFLFARRKQTASLWVGNHQERETLNNFKYAVISSLHLNENAASMYYAHVRAPCSKQAYYNLYPIYRLLMMLLMLDSYFRDTCLIIGSSWLSTILT